jgi:hypothetical protein
MAVCPHCKQDIPRSKMNKTIMQSLVGGWTCPKCHYEIGWSGKAKGPQPIETQQRIAAQQGAPVQWGRIALSLGGAIAAPTILVLAFSFGTFPEGSPLYSVLFFAGVGCMLVMPVKGSTRVIAVVLYLVLLVLAVYALVLLACGTGPCI